MKSNTRHPQSLPPPTRCDNHRLIAASFLTIAWCAASPAAGTDVPDLQEIEVIGSLPRPPDPIGLAPVTIIDGATLARSGATTLDELLLRSPVFGFQGVTQNQNNGGYGVSFVDLRNLNFNRTLVLIDGRRAVLSGIRTDEAVDLANIPVAMVERIEILPDGAAPKYGADAVAGVVNVVLKRDVAGLAMSAGSASSSRGDDAGGDFSATYGRDVDRGHITVGASWMRSDPIRQSSRPWARDPIDSASYGPDGDLMLARGSAATLAGRAVTASGSLGPETAGYDTSTASFLKGGLERATLNVIGRDQIADGAALFAALSVSDKLSTTQLPPQMLGLAGTPKHPEGFVIEAANPFNPYGQEVTLQRVLGEVGDQSTRSDNRSLQVVAGIEGRLFAGADWSLSLDHGESRTDYRTDNAVNLTRALQTVGAASDCPASEGCVPGDYFGAGSLSPAAAAYIRYTDRTRAEYLENFVDARIDLPFEVVRAGAWRATLGAEYRREYGQTLPSAVVLGGDQAGGGSAVTAGGYDSREVFVDVALPLLQDRRGARSLTGELSGRFVSTDLFGNFPVWRLDLSWEPVDAVRFRSGIGTARRVPAITEAFGGSTTSALDVDDPCDASAGLTANPTVAANCRALGLPSTFRQSSALIEVANGGNADLKPESSRSFNAGVVLAPESGRNPTLSIDYYRIVVHDAIDSLTDADPDFIPDQCLTSANLSSPLCRMIVRTPAGPSAGQISLIRAPDQNIGAIDTDGLDVDLDYRLPAGAAGTVSVDWQNTLLLDYRVQEVPGGAFLQEAGTFPSLVDAGSLTRYKSLLAADYAAPRWSAGWSVRYIGGARVLGDNAHEPFGRAAGIFYHDVNALLRFERGTLELGIDNLLDQKPPTLIDGISNTDLSTYDVVGRLFFLRASLKI